MKCTIEVEMDNAAFANAPGSELARILRRFANAVDGELFDETFSKSAMDANGNRVGALLIEVDEEDTKERICKKCGHVESDHSGSGYHICTAEDCFCTQFVEDENV